MFRALIFVVAAVLGGHALAASEADKQSCVANQSPDARIEACTRVLADQGVPDALRVLAYRGRATAYSAKRVFALAVLDFDEALKLSPRDPALYGGRGWALFELGQYDRAIADHSEQLRLNPRSDAARNNRGLAHLRKGEPAAALADFEEAIKINPRNLHARTNRGFVLAKQRKLDEAIADYSEVLRIDPEYLLAYSNRAHAYEEKGAIDLALADYKQVIGREGRTKNRDAERIISGAKQQLARLTKALGEGAKAAERRVALVIGNSDYEHAPALRNPANDARTIAAALRALGFTEVREVLNANLSALGKALKEFGDMSAGADWAVIYFAGHGIEVGGANYLIPVDAGLEQQSHIEDETVPLSRVLGKVTGASKMQLVILDACRNNPFVPKMRQAGRQTRAIGKGLASIEPESGVLIAYAARDGTTALDGDSANSPYAEALVKYLSEPGLEISLLFRKVRDDVLGKTARQQEPYTYGSLPAQPFYFKR
jgi:tetratricopeptide (TPR) repeat protein